MRSVSWFLPHQWRTCGSKRSFWGSPSWTIGWKTWLANSSSTCRSYSLVELLIVCIEAINSEYLGGLSSSIGPGRLGMVSATISWSYYCIVWVLMSSLLDVSRAVMTCEPQQGVFSESHHRYLDADVSASSFSTLGRWRLGQHRRCKIVISSYNCHLHCVLRSALYSFIA